MSIFFSFLFKGLDTCITKKLSSIIFANSLYNFKLLENTTNKNTRECGF